MQRRYLFPDYKGSAFEAWAKNYCAKNQWRVRHTIGDYEDCLAECATAWYEWVLPLYGMTVQTPQHLMRMFQTTVTSIFNTQSVKDTNDRAVSDALPTDEPSIESDAQLAAKLSRASSELTEVLKVIFDAPAEVIEELRNSTASYHPKQFFKAVVAKCGIAKEKAPELMSELQKLLGR